MPEAPTFMHLDAPDFSRALKKTGRSSLSLKYRSGSRITSYAHQGLCL
jgi:hypothetical protein